MKINDYEKKKMLPMDRKRNRIFKRILPFVKDKIYEI